MTLTWAVIPEFPDYAVSSLGHITRVTKGRNACVGKYRKTSVLKSGYPALTLRDANGDVRTMTLHRLVAAAFLGPCPKGHEVNHKNGIRSDARLTNLEYVTRSENMLDASSRGAKLGFASPGHSSSGCKNGNSKISQEVASAIREEYVPGQVKQEWLARKYGINQTTVSQIVRGVTWRANA